MLYDCSLGELFISEYQDFVVYVHKQYENMWPDRDKIVLIIALSFFVYLHESQEFNFKTSVQAFVGIFSLNVSVVSFQLLLRFICLLSLINPIKHTALR